MIGRSGKEEEQRQSRITPVWSSTCYFVPIGKPPLFLRDVRCQHHVVTFVVSTMSITVVWVAMICGELISATMVAD
jgi:hypothetical protein